MRKDVDKILNNVKATLGFEGLKPSEKALEINKKYLNGEITSDEAIKQIKSNQGFA